MFEKKNIDILCVSILILFMILYGSFLDPDSLLDSDPDQGLVDQFFLILIFSSVFLDQKLVVEACGWADHIPNPV